MTDARTCSRCGARLPGDGGACPRCLLHLGIELVPRDPDAVGRADAPSAPPSTARSRPARRDPPSLEEIAERFPALEVLGLLGRGGMGVVYKARQKKLDRLVALKILAPELTEDPDFAERFLREARALARLAHPNIVAVHDFGQGEGLCWLVMEYVDGANLRALLQTGELTPERALGLVAPMCDALQCAHDLGIVHRDVKPENVLVDKRGIVKIVDFGLAKLAGERGEAHLTRTEQVMGTPHYMAPEQMRASHDVDHRADIYSLGVVIYELLTGTLPVGNYALPSRRVAVDVRIDEVVLRAMEHEPERRYQHVVEVKTDVEAARTPAERAGAPSRAERGTPGTADSGAPSVSAAPDAAAPGHEFFVRMEAGSKGVWIEREVRKPFDLVPNATSDRFTAVLGVIALVLASVGGAVAIVASTVYSGNVQERNGWYGIAAACFVGGALFAAAVRRRYRAAHGAVPELDDPAHGEIDGALLATGTLALLALLAAGFGAQNQFPTEVLWTCGSLLGLWTAGSALVRGLARRKKAKARAGAPPQDG